MYSWLNIITQSQQTLIVDAGSPLNVKCKTEKCITFYLNDVSRNTFIFCIITALSGSNHELLCHLVCPLYLPELLAFLNAERRWATPVCVRNTVQAQAQILTSFVHISCFSPCLCRKPPFPGVNFFHYKGNWKGDGDYFFCLSPSDEFMHLKRSFVTRELALCACTISALSDGLYIIRAWESWEESVPRAQRGRSKELRQEVEKGILSLTYEFVCNMK